MKHRIAFVLPDMRGGGAERVALTLIRRLVERGHKVDLLLGEAAGELLQLVPREVGVVDLRATKLRNVVWPLVRYLRKHRPDSIQVSMWPLTIVAIVARMLGGSSARLVVSDHAILSDHYRSHRTRAVLRLTMRLFYPLADARVAVSNGAARDLANLSGIPLERFTVIHNPVELASDIRSTPEAESLWGSGRPRILTVGKLKEEKNQEFLIRAFARLRESDARLVIAGDGPLLARLEAVARELGVADRVGFPGYVADPWPLYATADLFVLPSREESFGNVLVEALHAGLPIVSTRTIGATEVLDGGRFGTLVDRDDPGELATAMTTILTRPKRSEKLAARAKEIAGEGSIAAYDRLLFGRPSS